MLKTLGVIAIGMALTGMGAAATLGAAQAPDPKLADMGKKLYATYKCDQCHQIAGRGSRKYPLDGVASKLTAADVRTWLTDPASMEAKLKEKPRAADSMANALKKKNILPTEVDPLVAYMMTLVKK